MIAPNSARGYEKCLTQRVGKDLLGVRKFGLPVFAFQRLGPSGQRLWPIR